MRREGEETERDRHTISNKVIVLQKGLSTSVNVCVFHCRYPCVSQSELETLEARTSLASENGFIQSEFSALHFNTGTFCDEVLKI